MNDSLLHSTLRELRAHVVSVPAAVAFCGVTFVLTIMGPFGSGELLRAVPRFAYWFVIVTTTYCAGFVINSVLPRVLSRRFSKPFIIVLAAVATGVAVSVIVALMNGLTLGYWPQIADWPAIFGNIFAIAFVIAVMFEVLTPAIRVQSGEIAQTPPIFDRLPFDLRAPLIALSVEDHYVRVHTTKGSEMILMRLGDAIREVGQTRGLQVHRSHWIARDAVSAVARKGDGAVLTMTNGVTIPVSRSNMANIKDAGLLPASRNG